MLLLPAAVGVRYLESLTRLIWAPVVFINNFKMEAPVLVVFFLASTLISYVTLSVLSNTWWLRPADIQAHCLSVASIFNHLDISTSNVSFSFLAELIRTLGKMLRSNRFKFIPNFFFLFVCTFICSYNDHHTHGISDGVNGEKLTLYWGRLFSAQRPLLEQKYF